MNRWSAVALLLALAGALALRVPRLDTRPLHNDEAVNAIKVAELWQHGRYAYDPDEYHGPTLHYFTLPFLWLKGAHDANQLQDATLRLAPALFGAALILLLPLFPGGLGRGGMTWAAIFLAISPAMVFYSRYFIHEMLLVFFSALMLGGGWRYVQTRSAFWAAVTGAAMGLMFATKETFVLAVAAAALAAFIVSCWTSPAGKRVQALVAIWNVKHVAVALAAAAIVWLIFFSSFFTHFAGLADSVRTYLPWLKRAGGHSPHIHPWNFYLERLAWFHAAKGPVWSEGLILLLAVVGMMVSLAGKGSPLRRFLALYTILLTLMYSAISYKTPWCMLGFLWGAILLAGIGASALIDACHARSAKIVVTMILLTLAFAPFYRLQSLLSRESARPRAPGAGASFPSATMDRRYPDSLARQAWQASFVYAADRRNPYVYAQTVPDILNLVRRVDGVAGVAPSRYDTVVKVIAPENDYWPLPWYLRQFKHIGWYDKMPADPFAPMVIVAANLDARLDDKSERKWIMAGMTELRPGKFFELYVELELWKKYVETLPRDRE